ncbi:hypothetical protein HOP50_04g30430 [Chloropicon primus]|nr:hypothetical protein HOP50_04g30430 [Chloropicon primus]
MSRTREEDSLCTVNLEVHLKKGYEPWTKLFDEDAKNRAAICDESRTTVAKVSEKLAIVILHGVRLAKFNAFVQNKDFAKMVKPYVEKHVPTGKIFEAKIDGWHDLVTRL